MISRTALLALSPFISLSTVVLCTGEKEKLELRSKKQRIVLMLGWFFYLNMACRTRSLDNRLWRSFSHLHSGISRFLTVLEKKSLKVFATSVSIDSILSLLTKIIASLDLTVYCFH